MATFAGAHEIEVLLKVALILVVNIVPLPGWQLRMRDWFCVELEVAVILVERN